MNTKSLLTLLTKRLDIRRCFTTIKPQAIYSDLDKQPEHLFVLDFVKRYIVVLVLYTKDNSDSV